MTFWQQIADWLAANWLTVFSIIIGIGGSVYGVMASRKDRVPCFAFNSLKLVEKSTDVVSKLSLKFEGYGGEFHRFTITKVALWNAGAETIRKEDIPKDDPIRIIAKNDVRILSAEVIYASNKVSRFECGLNHDKTAASITFQFFDKNQSVVLQLAHTGAGDNDLDFQGTVVGAARNNGKFRRIKNKRTNSLLFWALLITGVIYLAMGIREFVQAERQIQRRYEFSKIDRERDREKLRNQLNSKAEPKRDPNMRDWSFTGKPNELWSVFLDQLENGIIPEFETDRSIAWRANEIERIKVEREMLEDELHELKADVERPPHHIFPDCIGIVFGLLSILWAIWEKYSFIPKSVMSHFNSIG